MHTRLFIASFFTITVMLLSINVTTPVLSRDLLKSNSLPIFCETFDRHEPAADVAFAPGVDAYGRSVPAADLSADTQFQLPDSFEFPLTVDVIERLGIDQRQLGLEGNLALGNVVVDRNTVSLNGKTVSALNRADVVALCVRKPVIQ